MNVILSIIKVQKKGWSASRANTTPPLDITLCHIPARASIRSTVPTMYTYDVRDYKKGQKRKNHCGFLAPMIRAAIWTTWTMLNLFSHSQFCLWMCDSSILSIIKVQKKGWLAPRANITPLIDIALCHVHSTYLQCIHTIYKITRKVKAQKPLWFPGSHDKSRQMN